MASASSGAGRLRRLQLLRPAGAALPDTRDARILSGARL